VRRAKLPACSGSQVRQLTDNQWEDGTPAWLGLLIDRHVPPIQQRLGVGSRSKVASRKSPASDG
jgi:hypothetical protein